MRTIWLALATIPFALASPLLAQDSREADHAIREKLPLFAKNRCENQRDQASQLFCADPALIAAGEKLAGAIQERLARIPDRLAAVQENARWVKDRNQSCGIFGRDPIRIQHVEPVAACLLRETEERIAILRDPNFDCLATNTAAGALICDDPSLADAAMDLDKAVLRLIARLNGDAARNASIEYARWTRERDRHCNLAGKDNVPLQELSSSQDCLADDLARKTAEIAAARGDPKKVFGLRRLSPLPNADAVDRCVAEIHAANACENFLRVSRVSQLGNEMTGDSAQVKAQIEMIVLAPFAACSPVASNCTGSCWDLGSGKAAPAPVSRDSFAVSYRVKVAKTFLFAKADKDGWRCNATALRPVESGVVSGNRWSP